MKERVLIFRKGGNEICEKEMEGEKNKEKLFW